MTVTRTATRLFLLAAALALFVPSVMGATLLNITIEETVNQNVTFAEDFNLVENTSYSLIEGVITVDNPSTDPVYDANIRLDNITFLASDFIYQSGREGFQVIYPDVDGNVSTKSGQINSTWYDLGRDIDEDGTNDYVKVNDTHITFNITSEFELHSYEFYNGTNSSMNISTTPSPLDMYLNLSSKRVDLEYNDGVTFATVNITGTVNSSPGVLNLSEVTFTLNDTKRDYAIVHIPELRAGQQTVFNYNISSTQVAPPLDITTRYTNTEFETKVLAGERFWVQLVAENVATVGSLQDVNITMQAENVTVVNGSQSETFHFTLHNLSNDTSISEDYANVDNSSNKTWYWTVNSGTLPVGNKTNISFQIRAPDTINSSGTFLSLTQTLAYKIDTTASELYVKDVRARSEIDFNTSKQIVSPQDNESNTNVTWQSIPKVGTDKNITYTVEKVTLWVTTQLDPNKGVTGLEKNYTTPVDINNASGWTGSAWLFNFTDGSAADSPPPIVWVKPYWIIKNTANQIVNSTVTVNGTDLYMNYIYVVNGYWLEVEKRVLDAGNSSFDVKIEVRNRGNGYTPQNQTVTIYDFIPDAFTGYAFSPGHDNSSNVTGQFDGVAYQWDVGLRTNLSTSFAPKGHSSGLDVFHVNYSVNGTGDFSVSDLYIVGLDPRLVDGSASTFEGVSVITAVASTSREVLYLAVVVFLIAINVANFFMTSRIDKKLR